MRSRLLLGARPRKELEKELKKGEQVMVRVDLAAYFAQHDEESFAGELREMIEGKSPRWSDWLMALDLEKNYRHFQALALTVQEEGWPHGSEVKDLTLAQLSPRDRLLTLLIFFPATRQAYQEKGIPLSVLEESLKDFYLRERLYWERQGELGLTVEDSQWLLRIFALHIFKLVALQFELYDWQADEAYYHMAFTPEQKQYLAGGWPVLATHIMQEEDISRTSALASFEQAARFFPRYFPDFKAKEFYCFSWLLYPELGKALKPSSRIRQFQSLFRLVGQSAWPDMALKRIFEESPASKQDSSLKRLAETNPEILGVGIGLREIGLNVI